MSAPARSSWREVFAGSRGKLTLGLLLLEFAASVQSFVTATVLPLVARDTGGARFYGVALTAATVGLFVAMPFTGPLVDRFGARRVLGVATPVYLVGIALSAAAARMPVFAAGRLVQGLAAGAMAVFGLSAVARTFPPELRPRVLALIASMWLVPALVGPIGAALLTRAIGWRWTLVALVVPLLVGRLLAAGRLSDVPTRARTGVPVVATLVLTTGVVLLLGGAAAASPAALAVAAAGLVLVVAAVSRLLPAGTLAARPGQPASIGAFLLLTLVFFGVDGLLTLFVTEGLGRTVTAAAPALTAGTAGWALTGFVQPRLLEQKGYRTRPVFALGAGALLAGTALMLVVIAVSPNPAIGVGLTWLAWAIGGVGMGLAYPTLTAAAIVDVNDTDAGSAATAVVLAEALGGALGFGLGGSIVATATVATGHYRPGLLAAYTLFTVAAVVLLLHVRRLPTHLSQSQ